MEQIFTLLSKPQQGRQDTKDESGGKAKAYLRMRSRTDICGSMHDALFGLTLDCAQPADFGGKRLALRAAQRVKKAVVVCTRHAWR